MRGRETKKKLLFGNGAWCSKHALSRGNSQVTNRPVGSLGKMPKVVSTTLEINGEIP